MNPFGHPSQVRTQDLVLQMCDDLIASPFRQGLKRKDECNGERLRQSLSPGQTDSGKLMQVDASLQNG